MSALDFLKFKTMHQLEARVVNNGVCPKCHRKTLIEKSDALDMLWWQCSRCNGVYVGQTKETSP